MERPKLPRWILIVSIAVIVMIIVSVVILLLSPKGNKTQEEIDNLSYDITELEETLTEKLSTAAQNNPHKDYQTKLMATTFADLTANSFCLASNFSCPDILSKKTTKIPAVNSNALNYYLDQDLVVVIVSESSTLVVYGALYDIPAYLTFTTDQTDFDEYGYISRSDLFSRLTGSESFYTYNAAD